MDIVRSILKQGRSRLAVAAIACVALVQLAFAAIAGATEPEYMPDANDVKTPLLAFLTTNSTIIIALMVGFLLFGIGVAWIKRHSKKAAST